MSQISISGFEMIEKLGEGGMASVWKARQVSLDRTVAIKILSSRMAVDPADVQRFQTEAQSAAKLKHPGIIQVYDANVEGGLYYFVMEYVAGYTVGEWIRRKGVLPEEEALLVVECVADALDYAWSKAGIIHCDIKPDNVIIDADGTVKVADLGLSRTIRSMGMQVELTDIMGTPAFMSPEQASGDPHLDCRADIYSLGAMLYTMVTGKLLFEGQSEDRILELQCSDSVPDAIEQNPALTPGICWLLEKMLAKDRAHRHANWDEVRRDFKLVRGRQMPAAVVPDGVPSTVRRSAARGKPSAPPAAAGEAPSADVAAAPRRIKRLPTRQMPHAAPERPNRMPLILSLVFVVVAIVGFGVLHNQQEQSRQRRVEAERRAREQQVERARQKAESLYEFARRWESDNPGRYGEAIQRYQRVAGETREYPVSRQALDDIKRLSAEREARTASVLADLRRGADRLVEQQLFGEAARLLEEYAGAMAEETRAQRLALAHALHEQQERHEQEQRAAVEQGQTAASEILDQVAATLLASGVDAAYTRLRTRIDEGGATAQSEELGRVLQLLERASRIDSRILQSFVASIGQEVTVHLTTGPKTFVVLNVREDRIFGVQKVVVAGRQAKSEVSIMVKDLSPRERLPRMGSDTEPDVALAKGLLAFSLQALDHARKYFAATDPALAERLLSRIDESVLKKREEEARASLLDLLRGVGIKLDPYDAAEVLKRLPGLTVGRDKTVRLAADVSAYREKYAGCLFVQEADPVLRGLESLQPAAGVQAAEEQVAQAGLVPEDPAARDAYYAEVFKRFAADNPLLREDSLTTRRDEAGVIVEVSVYSPALASVAALAGIPTLRRVDCGGVGPGGRVGAGGLSQMSDIAALKGLPLERLYLAGTSVQDLSPLAGAPLEELILAQSAVVDLRPLAGLPLKRLDLSRTQVRDLTPLQGAPLESLSLEGCQVADLKPLSGAKLAKLNLADSAVKDIACLKMEAMRELNLANVRLIHFMALRNSRLENLNLSGTPFRDCTLLSGAPLKQLDLGGSAVIEIMSLRGMPLESLSLAGVQVRDFSILKGMPLRTLNLSNTRFSDAAVLRGMPLQELDLGDTSVSDISVLAEMRGLRRLILSNTRVRDLTPLTRLTLNFLGCEGLDIKDWAPLLRMPLHGITLNDPASCAEVLRTMPDLRTVNGEPWRDKR